MASESPCKLRMGREQYIGIARLDAEHIDFAGQTKFRFRFSEMRNPSLVDALLAFDFHGNPVRMDVGERAPKWLDSIRNPKSLSEKIGVRTGDVVRFVNFEDPILCEQIVQKDARMVGSEWKEPCNLIVFGVERPPELRQLESLAESVLPDGAVWVMLPRISKTITQSNILAAVRQAGLLDSIKPVTYSDSFTAYKVLAAARKRAARPALTRVAERRVTAAR